MELTRRQTLTVLGTATAFAGCLEASADRDRDHLATGDDVLTVAHRGSMYLWPENTLPAIENSLQTGADIVEFDLDVTADDEIIVIHDATVDRTTDGSGDIRDMTLEEAKTLDAGYGFPPEDIDEAYEQANIQHDHVNLDDPEQFRGEGIELPTLEEVLEAVDSDGMLLLDVKREGPDPAEIARLLREYDRVDSSLVGAFETTFLERMREEMPELESSTSLDELRVFLKTNRASEQRYDPGADFFWPPHEVVRPSLVERAHRNGMSIMPWTVNDPDEMERLTDIGVDSIITDDHLLLERVRDDFSDS